MIRHWRCMAFKGMRCFCVQFRKGDDLSDGGYRDDLRLKIPMCYFKLHNISLDHVSILVYAILHYIQ